MRVFISGATGVLGRALIPELLRHGHDVIGMARTDASRALLHAMRATVYSGQGLNAARLSEALENVHGIVHLATTLPADDAAIEDLWAPSREVTVGMLRNLLEASEPHGVRTVVFASFFGVYGDHGVSWVTEDTLPNPDETALAFAEAERRLVASTTQQRSAGVILRMGMVYAPDAETTRGLLYALKRGQSSILGDGAMYWPPIHAADAARAIRLALEQSPSGLVVNVCDDEPVQHGKLYRDLAEWLGGPPPDRAKTGQLYPYMGSLQLPSLRRSVRMSNQLMKVRLGMELQYPTYREGFRAVIEELGEV